MSSTLAACASSGAKTPPRATEPNPVIQTVYQTRTVCPAELRRPISSRPPVPADAVIRANEAGAAWLRDDGAHAAAVVDQLRDAQAACPAVEAAQP